MASKIDAAKKNPLCTICMEDILQKDKKRALDCMEIFHESCINPWLLIKHECPNCKIHVTGVLTPEAKPPEMTEDEIAAVPDTRPAPAHLGASHDLHHRTSHPYSGAFRPHRRPSSEEKYRRGIELARMTQEEQIKIALRLSLQSQGASVAAARGYESDEEDDELTLAIVLSQSEKEGPRRHDLLEEQRLLAHSGGASAGPALMDNELALLFLPDVPQPPSPTHQRGSLGSGASGAHSTAKKYFD